MGTEEVVTIHQKAINQIRQPPATPAPKVPWKVSTQVYSRLPTLSPPPLATVSFLKFPSPS